MVVCVPAVDGVAAAAVELGIGRNSLLRNEQRHHPLRHTTLTYCVNALGRGHWP